MAMLLGKYHFLAIAVILTVWSVMGPWSLIPIAGLVALGCHLFYKKSLLGGIFCFFVMIAWIDAAFIPDHSILNPKQTVFAGKITDIPKFDGDQLSFSYHTNQGETVLLKYRLKSNNEKKELSDQLKVGMSCRTSGRLTAPAPPSNFHAFDYKQYLRHQHIFWILDNQTFTSCTNQYLTPLDHIKQFRQSNIERVNQRFPYPVNAMINALVFGDRGGIDQDLINAYQSLGVIHLLAVSGLHVGLIIGCLYFIGLRLGFIKEHVIVGLLITIPIYIALTGAAPSVVRAGLMAMMLLTSTLWKLRMHTLDTISIVCFVMILYDPHVLYQLGFQLSFIVTSAFLISAPIVEERIARPIMKLFMLTVVAQLASFPIIVYHFYNLSLLSFLMNLIFIPLITYFVLPMAIMTFLLSYLSQSLSNLFAFVLRIVLKYAHDVLLFLNHHPFMVLNYGSASFLVLIAICICAYFVFYFWERFENKWSGWLLGSLFLVCYFVSVVANDFSPYGKITFLDVGQGDSIFIKLPFHEGNILIDTGGVLPFNRKAWEEREDPFQVGRDVVLHEMKAMGIHRIDTLVLTHRDYDHIGGVKDLIGKIPITQIVISDYFNATDNEKALFQKAEHNHIAIKKVRAGDTVQYKHDRFDVLSPFSMSADPNNGSIVLAAKLGGVSWLFTGDLEKEGELNLLNHDHRLSTDVLKIGHHGSKTSTSDQWLDHLHPKIAVISVGEHNRYGHPDPTVIERLHKHDIKILRTDLQGAIQFTFTKDKVTDIKFVK